MLLRPAGRRRSHRAHELDTPIHESCAEDVQGKGKVDGGVKSKDESEREGK